MRLNLNKKSKGLFHKFIVTRTDGKHRYGLKHCGCEYFVLDLSCDKYAIPALKAYAESCQNEYPRLAYDLNSKLKDLISRAR
ncbi:hypothetical protein LCGC14_2843660 [marine sediment metagenome]|uniref:Uncharacterized protein n=1 Tax=marine sediment metagenome TaxID=412755 RepID=A0A0F9AJ12_9ZZZZ